jgi:succinoglycan biosynthesis protein ExoU
MMRGVSVIIAAWNAAATIRRAVCSALREPEVGEVIVVDDASTDNTGEAALSADDGTGRLRIFSLASNRGPAFARNVAIEKSTGPLISVLDADDYFLAARFRDLLDGETWDFAADNVLFVDQRCPEPELRPAGFMPDTFFLDVTSFVEGNKPKSRGTELAFLQPVMRRSFLDSHQLRYNPELRLGEDYDLYARALAKGARFKVIRSCGYVSIMRPESLSRCHSTADLKRFCEVDDAIAGLCPAEARSAVREHQRAVRARYELRRFLDIKSSAGLVPAAIYAGMNPSALSAILKGIAVDKLRALAACIRPPLPPDQRRYLLSGRCADYRAATAELRGVLKERAV